MDLEKLLKQIKVIFMIDEELRAYLYDDRIELYDYTSPSESLDGKHKLKESLCNIITLYIEDNKISMVETPSISIITSGNCHMIKFVAALIGTEIKDYNDYDKLKSISQIETYYRC